MATIDVYPRPGVPLVPEALKPFIGKRLVDSFLRSRYSLPEGVTLGDLDERVWGKLSSAAIGALATQVLNAVQTVLHDLADVEDLVPVDPSGNGLSGRARNALIRAGLYATPWLPAAPLGDLVRLPGVGAKTLLELLTAAEATRCSTLPQEARDTGSSRQDAPPPPEARVSPAIRRAASVLKRRRWARWVLITDPRLGLDLQRLHSRARSAYDAAELLVAESLDPGGARRKVAEIRSFIATADKLRRLSLPEELEQIVRACVRSKDGRIALTRRLGFDGDEPVTLDLAGQAAGLTRERVRQIERGFRDAVERLQPWTPALDRALRLASRALPARPETVERLLQDEGLSWRAYSVDSLATAAEVFGRDIPFAYDAQTNILCKKETSITPTQVEREARRLVTHWGATTVDELRAELTEEHGEDVSEDFLRRLLPEIDGFSWLHREQGWFWIKGVVRNRLLNQIKKIMSVAGSLQIGELREGVGRHHRMKGFRPPRNVLAELCEQSGLGRREGDLIIEGPGLAPWSDVLGSVERRLVEVLFEHGPVMRRDDLERIAVEERGVNRSSFYVYLGYSPVIARYAPGVYGLRGARISAGEVRALVPPRVRRQVLLDHGWTTSGSLWLGYKLSPTTVTSGVLGVPSSLKHALRGSHVLMAEDGRPMGTLVVKDSSLWGVSPFFRRWGVEAGDHVVIEVHLKEGRATIKAGTEELLLRYQKGE